MNSVAIKKPTCIVCENSKLSSLLHIDAFPLYFGALPKDYRSSVENHPLSIAICEQCTLVQQIQCVDETIMNKVYEADYYNCPSPTGSGMGVSEIQKFSHFFNSIALKKGKLLEIACFDGYLLNKFRKNGWDVYGIDPSTATAQIVDLYPTDKIKNSFFTETSFPNEIFDVIVFRNLLEHIYDPN